MESMTTTPVIDPRRAALLLMDFQAGIVDSLPDADALIARTTVARHQADRAAVLVVYIRVAFTPQARAATSERNKSFAALTATDRLTDGAPDAEIDDRLRPAPHDLVVTKTRVGAFSTTDLAAQLATRGIDTLILAGIATSGVVLSTVRDAADRDYRLFVLADCCADRDPDVHTMLVDKLFVRQADIIDSSDLGGLLGFTATE
jgi:nicotinamidase-related amidase